MDKKELAKIIKEHIKRRRSVEKMIEDTNKVFQMIPESPFNDLVYSILSGELDLIEKVAKDKEQWISWFIEENDCGLKKLEAGFKGSMKPICTVEDLINLMKEIKKDKK